MLVLGCETQVYAFVFLFKKTNRQNSAPPDPISVFSADSKFLIQGLSIALSAVENGFIQVEL